MKKITRTITQILVCIAILQHSSNAQITLTSTQYLSKPAGVITDIIKVEGVTTATGIDGLSSSDKIRTYSYIDGFSRPLQNISEAVTPNGKDLIQTVTYDAFGRSTTNYLPFEYTSVTSGQPYQDRSTAISNQATFYTSGTTSNKIAYDTKPWVKSEIEESPMQRLLKQGNVGDGFQTNEHYKSMVYRVLDGSDAAVRKWSINGTSAGSYSANDLSVMEGIDENSVKTIVYTDLFGRTVLKRQQADENIGGTTYNWFDTYYVYDYLGNVIFVIPPKAVANMTSSGSWDAVSNTPNLIFSYKYDSKNRVIEKKVPSADVIYIVYDPLDRPLLVQTGNMRVNHKWFYSKFDGIGRVISEGIYTDATHTTFNDGTSTDMQVYVDGLSYFNSSSTTYYEERSSSAPYYTDNCFPLLSSGNAEDRIYNYYDDYDVNLNGTADYAYTSQSLPNEVTATSKTLGLPTVIKTKVLGTSDWLISVSYYNKWYNLIQVASGNAFYPDGVGKSTITSVIDFAGRLNERKEEHVVGRSLPLGTAISVAIRNTYSYDKMNRLTEIKQGHNGGTMIIVARYEYNPLGQLVDKKLHSTNSGSSFLQSVDYRYNIRGQLTSINNSALSNDGGSTNDESNDVWGMNLLYEQTETSSGQIGNTANWTGMLSAVKWKASISGGNNDQRTYLFAYDKLNRLSSASYKAYNTSTSDWTKDVNGYTELASYDWNGNIYTMTRKSVVSGSVSTIDDLSYTYSSSNDDNKLVNVTDGASNSYGFRNFTSSSSTTPYSYDANGNLTGDLKKGTTITYNELNKPTKIEVSSTKYVEYTYDAVGIRISKKIVNASSTTTYKYVAGLVVDAGSTTIKYFAMAEGRVRKNGSTFTYEYFITDQQGNVRVSFEDNGSGTAVARQENSYYPFGMSMSSNYTPTDPNNRLYNAGSQFQDDFSGIIDYYSTFFREYDPVLARFNSVDPKARMTFSLSIYQYSNNNPINLNDPFGDWFGGGGDEIRPGFDFNRYRPDWSFSEDCFARTTFWNSILDRFKNATSDEFISISGISPETVSLYFQLTWGTSATGISAVESGDGFDISYTATSSGKSYTSLHFTTQQMSGYINLVFGSTNSSTYGLGMGYGALGFAGNPILGINMPIASGTDTYKTGNEWRLGVLYQRNYIQKQEGKKGILNYNVTQWGLENGTIRISHEFTINLFGFYFGLNTQTLGVTAGYKGDRWGFGASVGFSGASVNSYYKDEDGVINGRETGIDWFIAPVGIGVPRIAPGPIFQ
jgi:RHS repeat-associated protein